MAGNIIDFVEEGFDFVDVNINQLMRTTPGEGMLSLQMKHHPHLVGRSISEVFHGDGSPAFALSRNHELIWHPAPEILPRFDDVLICYGPLDGLRSTLRKSIAERNTVSEDNWILGDDSAKT